MQDVNNDRIMYTCLSYASPDGLRTDWLLALQGAMKDSRWD